ncbi:MAG: hypothetical protein QOG54_2518 [Actinomycetota bacterium]|jgi:hypothetical protein|nr:hypothetical protein [Actinomycetota bacterium]
MERLVEMSRRKIKGLIRIATVATVLAAVKQELEKPEGQRDWHGTVAGFVPYDFRAPTPEKVKAALWNPDDDRIVVPQVWGVGWTLNLGRLWRMIRGAMAARAA